jgi:5-methylcytosine-specific restriction enzyme subunit McrC
MLTERRTRVVRLPRADAAFLRDHAAHAFDLTPAFEPHRYRVTPRGVVGFLDGPTARFVVRPKLPWPDLLRLLGADSPPAAGGAGSLPADLLAALAREFARRLADTAARGLIAGYSEADTESPFLRGKLRTAEHLRETASGRQPLLFPVTEDRFGLDTPWSRVPKTVAGRLLALPDLPPVVRDELRTALVPFDAVPERPVNDAEFAAACGEVRAAHYRPLLDLARTLHNALEESGGGFLIDLGRMFERYVGDGLRAAFARWSGGELGEQPRFELAGGGPFPPPVLQPDFVVRRGGKPRFVLDAKWKGLRPGPAADDLHQILAYAAAVGVGGVALVYPGARFARHDLTAGGVRVSVVRVAVRGGGAAGVRSFRRLARVVRS